MSNNSSNVYLSELDLSQVIVNAINSTGAIVFASSQRQTTPQLITNTKQFVNQYGSPNPQVSYGHYCALAFLQQASQLYANRAVHADATYGGAMLQALTTNASTFFNYPAANPAAVNLASTVNGSTQDQNLAFFYPVGPGSYAQNIAVQVQSQNMLSPTGLTSSVQATTAKA